MRGRVAGKEKRRVLLPPETRIKYCDENAPETHSGQEEIAVPKVRRGDVNPTYDKLEGKAADVAS